MYLGVSHNVRRRFRDKRNLAFDGKVLKSYALINRINETYNLNSQAVQRSHQDDHQYALDPGLQVK